MFCSNCGKEISSTDKFCVHCGHSINKPVETEIVSNEPEIVKDEVQEISSQIIPESKENNFLECADIIKMSKVKKSNRQELIAQLIDKGYTEKQSEYMIQHFDNGVDFNKLELSDLESPNYTKFISTDFIDKYTSVKTNKYTNEELAEERLRVSTNIMYIVAALQLAIGIYFSNAGTTFGTINGGDMILGSSISLISTFIFHKLRMPLFVSFVALFMLFDKFITHIYANKISGSAVLFMLAILLAAIQAFRSNKYIVSNSKKLYMNIARGLFLIYVFFAIFGTYLLFTENNWDNSEMSKVKSNVYETVHTALVNNKGSDSEELRQISRKTAECTIDGIKKEYQSFNKLEEQVVKNAPVVKLRVEQIRKNCLDKYNN